MHEKAQLTLRTFNAIVIALGSTVLVTALIGWHAAVSWRFSTYFLLAVLASGLRSSMPTFPGVLSAGYLFVLIGIVDFSLGEAVLMGCAAILVQCAVARDADSGLASTLFRVSNTAIAVCAAHWLYRSAWPPDLAGGRFAPLLAASAGLYLMNSFPAAARAAIMERWKLVRTWHRYSSWSLPGCVLGTVGAFLIASLNDAVGWRGGAAALPLFYFAYRWAGRYLAEVRAESDSAEDSAAQQQRIAETLGMAINARQYTSDDRSLRTEVVSVGVGRVLGLGTADLAALRMAAHLHDVGTLAVPEHLVSKAGRLTKEEFERVKTHAAIGAAILEQAQFPSLVPRLVRHHHERWNGSGYPDGLSKQEIPVGARILAAADCYAALLADRPHRPAVSRQRALEILSSQAGEEFDPDVVAALIRNHAEFEREIRERTPAGATGYLNSISAARRETQGIFNLTQVLGSTLCIDETLSTFATQLQRIVAFDGLAVLIEREGRLLPQYAWGVECPLLYSLEIPPGSGVSGKVFKSGRPIRNGNPARDFAHLRRARKSSRLLSALSVPLDSGNGSLGVLTLYRKQSEAFTPDDQRVIEELAGKLAGAVENALRYQDVADSATTDSLTGVANARSLFLHLDNELARCRRSGQPVAVLVCDLDGFKQVNDVYGHLAGNAVLRAVADVLKKNCREYDFVARMGGDEFVMVLPGLPAGAVTAKIGVLSEAVARAAEAACPGSAVCISAGQARYPDDGRDTEALLAEADRKMYRAKAQRKLAVSSRGFDFDHLSVTAR